MAEQARLGGGREGEGKDEDDEEQGCTLPWGGRRWVEAWVCAQAGVQLVDVAGGRETFTVTRDGAVERCLYIGEFCVYRHGGSRGS